MSQDLSINDVTIDGFWTLYLSVILLVIVITVATLLKPPASISHIPPHAEKASMGITLIPLPLGQIDSLDPSTIGVINSMVTNHNLTAKILIGGDPTSEESLKKANHVEQVFHQEGIASDTLKAMISPTLEINTAEVHFDKAKE